MLWLNVIYRHFQEQGMKDHASGNILIVSSHYKTLHTLGAFLRQRNLKPIRMNDEPELLYLLKRNLYYDSVLIDLTDQGKTWLPLIKLVAQKSDEKPIIVIIPQAQVDLAITSLKYGATDYIVQPIDGMDVYSTLKINIKKHSQKKAYHFYKNQWGQDKLLFQYPIISTIMREKIQKVLLLARTSIPLTLEGVTGSGLEELAYTIHFLSHQRFAPFLKIDCGNTTISELDMILKKYITGSRGKYKRYNESAEGTLFLDQVTKLPMDLQHRIIDFFDEMLRLNRSNICLRIICTTGNSSVDLTNLNVSKEFSERFLSTRIKLPPIAARKEDIPEIAEFFVEKFSNELHHTILKIENEAMKKLINYTWPGDFIELKNIMERAVILAKDSIIRKEDVFVGNIETDLINQYEFKLPSYQLQDVEELLIERVLERTDGNMTQTASTLGISRGTLYNKMKKYGLENSAKKG
jgi:two-component system response regulator AtoC